MGEESSSPGTSDSWRPDWGPSGSCSWHAGKMGKGWGLGVKGAFVMALGSTCCRARVQDEARRARRVRGAIRVSQAAPSFC